VEIIHSARPLYAMGVSLIAIVLILLSGEKKRNLREFWTILAAVVKFAIVLSMLPAILDGKEFEFSILTILPGLDIAFRVDALGIAFALTASFLWIITSLYSIGYMRSLKEHEQTRFFVFFAVSLSATIGVAFAANMFTLFLFYEAITLCTYPLVIHKETPEARRGARKYIVYLLGTSLAFQLFAIFLTYSTAGTLDFAHQGILAGTGSNALLTVIFVLFMAGIAKAGIIPLHSWLPAAMVAPTPVSALLHAVAVVKAGVFTVTRVVLYIFGVDLLSELGMGVVLVYFASFTIIVASIIALKQDNLKARLAYSTVSQLSYIILGVALLTPSGIAGGIIHLVVHAFSKITLFFAAGAIYVAHHKTRVSELNGIGRQMPFTMAAFAIGSLSMIGLPPTAGFISKWYLFFGSIEAHQMPIIIVLLASIILNACYFLPIVYVAFFKKLPPGETAKRSEAPAFMVVPIMVSAIGTVVLLFWPSLLFELAGMIATSATGGN
jgi:multicomponent Na+:H+ antiporter subunit D